MLTDFGLRDHYVGVMKGVILGINPAETVVDLCHEVPPQDIRTAAFQLMASVPYFPKGALFVCVVDPGVGSKRRILWVKTAAHQFLVPDNGIISWISEAPVEVRELTNRDLWASRVSATFHGRDIFAPVAGKLLSGLKPEVLGPKVERRSLVRFAKPGWSASKKGVTAEILCVDHFGNAITGILGRELPSSACAYFQGKKIGKLLTHYSSRPEGSALALVGASGYVELAVRNGSFAGSFKAAPGDRVEFRTKVR